MDGWMNIRPQILLTHGWFGQKSWVLKSRHSWKSVTTVCHTAFIRIVHGHPSGACSPIWGASLVTQMVKNLLAMQEAQVWFLVRKIPWRRQWKPTPVFLPGEFPGQRSLVGYNSWGHKESDMTQWLTHRIQISVMEQQPNRYIPVYH